MAASAAGAIGYAVMFFIWNFTDAFLEFGIGPGEVDVEKGQIQAFSPSLYQYISHLHIGLSGFIAGTGVAMLFLVAYGVRRGELWAWVGTVSAAVVALVVALPAHYPNDFDTLWHLGPVYLSAAILTVGAALALRGIMRARSG